MRRLKKKDFKSFVQECSASKSTGICFRGSSPNRDTTLYPSIELSVEALSIMENTNINIYHKPKSKYITVFCTGNTGQLFFQRKEVDMEVY